MHPYQQPAPVPQYHPCARCGAYPGPQPYFSPQGHPLCHMCFHQAAQAAAQGRAMAPMQSSANGYTHFGGSDASMQAGLSKDLEAKLLRRCAKCNAHAVKVAHVTFHYVNGITRGRTYRNECKACGATFITESFFRTLVEGGAGVVSMLVGLIFVFPLLDARFSWSSLMVLLIPFGGWLTGRTIARVIARFRNPVVPQLPAP